MVRCLRINLSVLAHWTCTTTVPSKMFKPAHQIRYISHKIILLKSSIQTVIREVLINFQRFCRKYFKQITINAKTCVNDYTVDSKPTSIH